MRLRYLTLLFLGLSAAGRSARAQDALSLKDAVRLALEKNKGIEASAAGQQAAGSRILAARAGMLPKVSYSESWTRSEEIGRAHV